MTTKEETEYELKVLENINREWLERAKRRRRSTDLIRGVALGLLYGIIGNLFVQFFFPVVETLIVGGEYDTLFFSNVAISVVALVIILYTTIKFRGQLTQYEKEEETAQQQAEVTRKAIQTRKAKLNIKKCS
jgi:nitrate/nitrite transporter NarK